MSAVFTSATTTANTPNTTLPVTRSTMPTRRRTAPVRRAAAGSRATGPRRERTRSTSGVDEDAHPPGLLAATAGADLELDLLALLEAAVAVALDGGEVHEHVAGTARAR